MRCAGANDQRGVRAWLLAACVVGYMQAAGEARGKALRSLRALALALRLSSRAALRWMSGG